MHLPWLCKFLPFDLTTPWFIEFRIWKWAHQGKAGWARNQDILLGNCPHPLAPLLFFSFLCASQTSLNIGLLHKRIKQTQNPLIKPEVNKEGRIFFFSWDNRLQVKKSSCSRRFRERREVRTHISFYLLREKPSQNLVTSNNNHLYFSHKDIVWLDGFYIGLAWAHTCGYIHHVSVFHMDQISPPLLEVLLCSCLLLIAEWSSTLTGCPSWADGLNEWSVLWVHLCNAIFWWICWPHIIHLLQHA